MFRCAKTSGPRPGAKCANCSLYFLGIKDGIQEIIASLAGLHVRRQRHYCLHSLRSFGDRLEVDGPGSKDGDSLVEGHVAAVDSRQIFMRKVSRHYPHLHPVHCQLLCFLVHPILGGPLAGSHGSPKKVREFLGQKLVVWGLWLARSMQASASMASLGLQTVSRSIQQPGLANICKPRTQ